MTGTAEIMTETLTEVGGEDVAVRTGTGGGEVGGVEVIEVQVGVQRLHADPIERVQAGHSALIWT